MNSFVAQLPFSLQPGTRDPSTYSNIPPTGANRGRPFSSTPRMLPFRFCLTSSPDAWHTKPLASPSLNAHWAR
eukprot:4444430-Pleurochrysis_carterae.AAC.1